VATIDPFRVFIDSLPDPLDDEQIKERIILYLRDYRHESLGRGPTTAVVARGIGHPDAREAVALALHTLADGGRVEKREGGWYLRLGG
jgi:hypothetical protein